MRRLINWAWDMVTTIGLVIYACVFVNEGEETDE